jgi:predicted porin
MKKTLIALAALAATTAFAQSTVTINGVLDVGVRNTSKVAAGAAKLSATSGNNNRIGFGVVEDLGGGLKATANAEMRFDPTTGNPEAGRGEATGRPLFQGQTRVGLMGGFGTVMLGRGLTALQLANGGNSDPWGVTTAAGSVYAAGFATDYAAGGEGRIDQGIWYTSPTMGGFTLSATMSPRKIVTAAVAAAPAVADAGGVQGTNAVTASAGGVSKTSQSINLTYAAGPLVIGVGNERNRANDTITQVYGNYNMGVAKLFASYATIEGGTAEEQRFGGTFAAAASAVNTGTAPRQVAAGGEIKNWTVGATVPMGAATIRVGYSGWNGSGAVGQQDDTKFGLGVKYDLSKRTFIYSNIAQQTRKNFTGTAAAGRDNTSVQLFDLGVGHSF